MTDLPVRTSFLTPHPGQASLLDGAWWPRSRELTVEIPLLAADFASRGVRISRVIYHPEPWQVAPNKLRLVGHTVHLGWFREIDPNLISLRTSDGARIELLVVPPETDPAVAAAAMAMPHAGADQLTPTQILAAAYAVEKVPA
jgi:hypothetical protein